jgi:transmembrane sensor
MDYELMFRYLTNKATPEEIEIFEEWLNLSETNKARYNDWVQFWEITGKSYLDFEPDIEKRWKEFDARINHKENKSKGFRLMVNTWYRVAASVLLFIILGTGGYVFYKSGIMRNENYLTFDSGNDTLSLRLKDGSHISLNAHSAIKIPESFSKENRTIQFTGEAFFSIVKDPAHPFKVYTGNTVTEVLGTTFNIKSVDSNVAVTLVTGKVAFYKVDDDIHILVLHPGQHAIFNNSSGLLLKDTISNLNNICWKTRKLQFNHTPMNELCTVLSSYYKKKIRFIDSDKSKGNFTGIINNISLNEAINIIELTMNLKATQYADSVVFSAQNIKAVTPD